MKRLAGFLACFVLMTSPAMATSIFSKYWKDKYLDKEKVSEEFYRAGRKAGCYICHVKGKKKEEARNEYGQAVNKHLDAKDFTREWVKANPEEAEKKILKGFEEANKMKDKNEKVFGEKIKKGELPATNANL